MSQNRNLILDAFKGLAIGGIVFGHTVIGNAMSNDIQGDPNALTMLSGVFFSGLMVFLIISGFYYKPERSYWENIKRRVLQLGVVLVLLTILLPTIVFVSEWIVHPERDLVFADLGKYIAGMLIGPYFMENMGMFDEGYFHMLWSVVKNFYFIQMLLVSFVIYYAIADKCMKSPALTVSIMVVCVILTWLVSEYRIRLPFYAEMAPLALFFLLIGATFKKIKFDEYLETGYRTEKYWAICFLLIFSGFCVLVASPVKLDIMELNFGYYGGKCAFPFFVSMTLCGVGLLMLTSVLHFVPTVLKHIAAFGKYTIYVYVLHLFFAKWIISFYRVEDPNPHVTIPFSGIGESIIYFILCLVLPMLTMMIVERIKSKMKERKNNQA